MVSAMEGSGGSEDALSRSADLPHIAGQEAIAWRSRCANIGVFLPRLKSGCSFDAAICRHRSTHESSDPAGAGSHGAADGFGWRGGQRLAVGVVARWRSTVRDSLDGRWRGLRGVERPRYASTSIHVLDIVGITFYMTGLACSAS